MGSRRCGGRSPRQALARSGREERRLQRALCERGPAARVLIDADWMDLLPWQQPLARCGVVSWVATMHKLRDGGKKCDILLHHFHTLHSFRHCAYARRRQLRRISC